MKVKINESGKKKFKFRDEQTCDVIRDDLYAYVIKRTANYVTLKFHGNTSTWAGRFDGVIRRFKIRSREVYGIAEVEFVEYKNFYCNGNSTEIFATDTYKFYEAKNLKAVIAELKEKLAEAEAELKALIG